MLSPKNTTVPASRRPASVVAGCEPERQPAPARTAPNAIATTSRAFRATGATGLSGDLAVIPARDLFGSEYQGDAFSDLMADMRSGLCFVGLSVNNLLLVLDRIAFTDVDLSMWRLVSALVAPCLLLFGLIWEHE